jgi:hypothetical protein
MKTTYSLAVLGLIAFTLLGAETAGATDQQDLAVALKTLPLLTNKIASPAVVAVLYDQAVPASKNDAEKIKSVFDGGLKAPGDIHLDVQLVGMTELSQLSKAKIAFVAEGLPMADYSPIRTAASAAGTLTISADQECVKTAACVLGVSSKPQVEVYYNPAAAEAARIGFASAFTMLAKQVGSP